MSPSSTPIGPEAPGAQLYLVNTTGAVVGESGVRAVLKTIGATLRVRDDLTRNRLLSAVRAAIDGGASSVLLVGADLDRQLVLVRPASEGGCAVVASTPIDSGVMLLDPQQLRQLYNLSKSEADIAIGILRGASLVEIAEDRHVQHETVRGQVKTLLHKVGVANQKQLVARLVQVAAAMASVMSLGEPSQPFWTKSA